jgi:formamidopyrimidine-DNA glycosylase
MPELPEVETVRRGLARHVVGRTVVAAVASGARTVRRTSAAAVEDGVRGRRVVDARRRGKYLLLGLDDGADLLVHLRMSGQLLLAPADDPAPPHTHVRLGLDDGRELRFVDPRTFGEVVVVHPERLALDAPGLAAQGPDPLLDRLGPAGLARRLRGRRKAKDLLTDQRVVAGLGSIYADEVLWAARIRYDRPGDALALDDVARLVRAMRRVLADAVEAGGSTLGDGQYVDLDGQAGRYQLRHAVHARAGAPCPRCGKPIERHAWSGRSAYGCPRCQR